MDISKKIRVLQAMRGLNDSQTAEKLGIHKQNYSRKLKNQTFSLSDIQKIADILEFEAELVFTDRETGKKL